MPDNPTRDSLLAHAARVQGAQDKLRAAMAQVAAEVAAAPPAPAVAVSKP